MKLSLTGKIFGLFAGTLVVLLVVTIGVIGWQVNRGFNTWALHELDVTQQNVQSALDGLRAKSQESAAAFAARPDVVQAIDKGDGTYLRKVAQEYLQVAGIDVLTISDKAGTVLARGHAEKAGDSVAGQSNVQRALKGEATAVIEEGTVIKLSYRAGHPVKKGDLVVGVITTGKNLTDNHAFVDEIKKQYEVECTIFQGDTRVSTTVIHEGKRAVGTKMETAEILQCVLKEGKVYSGISQIFGEAYNAHYWPLKGPGGETAGMVFIGQDRRIIRDTFRQAVVWSLLTSGIVIGLSLLLTWLASRRIGRQLNTSVDQVFKGTQEITDATRQLSAGSMSLSEGASEQAASLEETSASLEELSSMTRQNSEHAQHADDLARQSRAAADSGMRQMEEMVTAMQAIKTASDNISRVIKTIDEIAFQTNILALNAAVEAARAGTAGAGFSVVADEVRSLAQRSAQAAKETAAMIEDSIGKSQNGVRISTQVGESLKEIVTKASQVEELVGKIAAASKEQSQGIDQVTTAVSQMDKVTQGNAANAEESAAVAGELNSQVERLERICADLLQLAEGGKAQARARAAVPQIQGGSTAKRTPESRPAPAPQSAKAGGPLVLRPHKPAAEGDFQELAPAPGLIPMPDVNPALPKQLIAWDEGKMTTGVPAVDQQHCALIDQINALHAACMAGTGREELLKMMHFLGEYAQKHFADEERIMEECACPSRAANKSAHLKFLHRYGELLEKVKKEGASTSVLLEVKEMLGDWLKNHICKIDTKLKECPRHDEPHARAE